MTESRNTSHLGARSSGRVILLERGGELSTFARILEELGMRVERFAAGLPPPDSFEGVRLVVATAQRLVESGPPHLSAWPTTLVVVREASKTLSAHLNRIGVSMILCQPVHPQALRLLLLHSIYRGPERRHRKRTAIGHPIRVSTRFFRTRATLLELSPTGARIAMARMPKIGSGLRMHLGKDLTGGRPLKLRTQVMRRISKPGGIENGRSEIGLSILDASLCREAIEPILSRFARGPAVWKSGAPTQPAEEPRPESDSANAVEEAPAHAEQEAAVDPAPEFEAGESEDDLEYDLLDDGLEPIDEEDGDRREQTRIPYQRRIVALDEAAARVLVGRDLSPGGMRIVSNSTVAVDDVLRVALHCGTQMEPLVVMARATRDDGDGGLVLVFEDLVESQREHLEKIIASSGPIRSPQPVDAADAGENAALIVGEVLDAVADDEMPRVDGEPAAASSDAD